MTTGTALLLNLRNASCCEPVFRGAAPQRLADRFGEVDPNCRDN